MKHFLQRFIYRTFRIFKMFFLAHPSILGKMFFWCIEKMDGLFSERKADPLKLTETRLRKGLYINRYGTKPLYSVSTDKPVAVDSHDHIWPRGTLYDNSTNRMFNLKLYSHFAHTPELKLLDLGCSGGGLVSSVIEDGYEAIGLEGSDISKRLRGGEWDVLLHHLFTSDITSPFEIKSLANGTGVQFHCITMWEVLEHIPEDKLPILFANIKKHLRPQGIFVGSVDMTPDGNVITGAKYHVTLKPKDWWLAKFAESGLVPVDRHSFQVTDYVRGHGRGLKDWDPADGEGFHVVLGHK